MITIQQHTGTIDIKPNVGTLELRQASGTIELVALGIGEIFYLLDFSDFKNSMYITLL